MNRFKRITWVLLAAFLFLQAGFAEDKPASGEDIFKANCVLCHGSDGRAKTPLGQQLKAMDLHSPEVQKRTNADLKKIILGGQKSMPPFQGQLSSTQVDQVLVFVRQLGKKK